MPSHLIETYKLRLEILRDGNPATTVRNRILELVSPPQFHGIIERAILNFSTRWDSWSSPEAVGYRSSGNPYQPVIWAWLPSSEFSLWYDALRSEKPLTFSYELRPIGGVDYIRQITLGSSHEPAGEGPADFTP